MEQLYTEDKYFVTEQIFNIPGLDVIVIDDIIIEVLQSLPKYKRDIILLSYPLIVLAANGDVDAINAVLKHYEGYIAALFTRQLYDESGNSHLCVDELLHRRCGTNELNDWNEYKNSLQITSRKQNPTFQNWKNS